MTKPATTNTHDNLNKIATINNPKILQNPAVISIFKALNDFKALNYCDKSNTNNQNLNLNALIVGGAVRDCLLNRPINDIDFATKLTPDEVIKRLNHHNINNYPSGIEHGTVTAVFKDSEFQEIQITTLRSDEETDGRHAKVQFTNDWLEDAKRRDFTINAMYMDNFGNIYDTLNQGYHDCKNKSLNFIGDPLTRLTEDNLRLWRYFRFLATLEFNNTQNNQTNPELLNAFKQTLPHLHKLSKERVTFEWKKLLCAPQNGLLFALQKMADYQIIKQSLNLNLDLKKLQILNKIENHLAATTIKVITAKNIYPLFKLLSICDEADYPKLHDIFALTKPEKNYIKAITNLQNTNLNCFDDESLNDKTILIKLKILRLNISEEFEAFALIHQAVNELSKLAELSQISDEDIKNAAQKISSILQQKRPQFPINGNDLKQFKIAESPEIGKQLKILKSEWIKSGGEKLRDDLLNLLRNNISNQN